MCIFQKAKHAVAGIARRKGYISRVTNSRTAARNRLKRTNDLLDGRLASCCYILTRSFCHLIDCEHQPRPDQKVTPGVQIVVKTLSQPEPECQHMQHFLVAWRE